MSFHLIANPISEADFVEASLNDGFVLRKPNIKELQSITLFMARMFELIKSIRRPHETISDPIKEVEWIASKDELFAGKHNYWIIHKEKDDLSYDETIPMLLTDNRLLRLCRFTSDGKLYQTYNQTFVYLRELSSEGYYMKQVKLDSSFTKQYFKIRQDFKGLSYDWSENIKSAAIKFQQLNSIPKTFYFRVIALFGILESILINNNSKNDFGTGRDLEKNRNAITRQLQAKILFLHREFSNKLKFEDYFDGSNPETILKNLYTIRSKVAHGAKLNWIDDINLQPKGKSVFHKDYIVNDFMTELCRHIIISALEDPIRMKEFREI